jgi:hypothetical protein
MHSKKDIMVCYAFILVAYSCLLFLPLSLSAQSTNGFLSFGNCKIEFLYPVEWKNFITEYTNCEDNNPNRPEDSLIEIALPQPNSAEKNTSRVTISVGTCCEVIPSKFIEGHPSPMKNITLEEYVNQTINNFNTSLSIIGVGHISLAGNEAYKIVAGLNMTNPAAAFIYSKNGTKLYSIEYRADPSDYDTYWPGVQKIVDSFKMLVS